MTTIGELLLPISMPNRHHWEIKIWIIRIYLPKRYIYMYLQSTSRRQKLIRSSQRSQSTGPKSRSSWPRLWSLERRFDLATPWKNIIDSEPIATSVTFEGRLTEIWLFLKEDAIEDLKFSERRIAITPAGVCEMSERHQVGPGKGPDGAHRTLLLRYADLMTINDITYDRNVLRNFWIAVRIKHSWRAMMYSLRSPTSPTRISPEAFFTRTLLCTASSYIRYPGLLLRASAYRVLLAPMPESCTMKCALCLLKLIVYNWKKNPKVYYIH